MWLVWWDIVLFNLFNFEEILQGGESLKPVECLCLSVLGGKVGHAPALQDTVQLTGKVKALVPIFSEIFDQVFLLI